MVVEFTEEREEARISSVWKKVSGPTEHDIFMEQGKPWADSRGGYTLARRIITRSDIY